MADQFGWVGRVVIKNDGDLVGLGDDVIIGHHDAGLINDEARSQRLRTAAWCLAPAFAFFAIKKVVEEIFEWRAWRRLRALAPRICAWPY